jgi:hypothetical protein
LRTKTYSKGYYAITKRLESLGYEMYQSKNSWGAAEYKGVNTRWVNEEGQRFEVQFHIPESFHAKQCVTHSAYERILFRGPADTVHEADRFLCCDLEEQVAAFGADQQRAAVPHRVQGERLVAPAAVTVAAPEHADRPVRAAEVVYKGVVGHPVRPSAGPHSRDLPARVRRVAGDAVRARRHRDVRVDLPLEGLQREFLRRTGPGRTQPRISMLGGERLA